MSRSLIPLGERCVVMRVPDDERSEGGVYIPQTAQAIEGRMVEPAILCVVLELPTDTRPQRRVKQGDHVLVSPFSGFATKLNGDDALIVALADVLAVVVIYDDGE